MPCRSGAKAIEPDFPVEEPPPQADPPSDLPVLQLDARRASQPPRTVQCGLNSARRGRALRNIMCVRPGPRPFGVLNQAIAALDRYSQATSRVTRLHGNDRAF